MSPKCFYAHRKGPSVKEISDEALIVLIKQLQQEYGILWDIGRNFFALEPFKRFVCDITYLTGCDETWYLSVIEDLFNGEIVGWNIGEHCTAALCIETVMMMKETIGKTEGVILHSDGGSTYISYDYRELLLSLGIKQSMGKKLTCYDNARIESFNGILKAEANSKGTYPIHS